MSSISSPISTPLIEQQGIKPAASEQRGIAYTGLLLFLFMLAAALQSAFPIIDTVKPVQMIAMISLGAAFIGKFTRRESFVLRGPTFFLLMFMGITGLSVPGALWPGAAFDTAVDALKILAIFLLISNVVMSERKLNGVAWALCLGSIVPAAGTIKNYINGEGLVDGFRAAWVGLYGNPNDLSYILAMMVPLAMALITNTRRNLAKLIGLGCLSLYTLAIFFTFSRLGFLCLLMIMVMTFLRSQQRVRNFALIILLGLLAMPFVPDRYWDRIETIKEFQDDKSASDRLVAWNAGIEMLSRNPILGVGPGCYILGWPEELREKYGTPRSAHNTFFQVMGELGVLGLVTFLGFLLSSWGLVWSLKRKLLARRQLLPPETFKTDYSQLLTLVTAIDIGFWVFIVSSLTGGLLFTWYPYIFSAMGIAASEIYKRKEI